jgi:hypothetical protein
VHATLACKQDFSDNYEDVDTEVRRMVILSRIHVWGSAAGTAIFVSLFILLGLSFASLHGLVEHDELRWKKLELDLERELI